MTLSNMGRIFYSPPVLKGQLGLVVQAARPVFGASVLGALSALAGGQAEAIKSKDAADMLYPIPHDWAQQHIITPLNQSRIAIGVPIQNTLRRDQETVQTLFGWRRSKREPMPDLSRLAKGASVNWRGKWYKVQINDKGEKELIDAKDYKRGEGGGGDKDPWYKKKWGKWLLYGGGGYQATEPIVEALGNGVVKNKGGKGESELWGFQHLTPFGWVWQGIKGYFNPSVPQETTTADTTVTEPQYRDVVTGVVDPAQPNTVVVWRRYLGSKDENTPKDQHFLQLDDGTITNATDYEIARAQSDSLYRSMRAQESKDASSNQ